MLGSFAYLLTYLAGQRGFFALDQAFIFDGGYRILFGQVPYKDFVVPFGPVVFLVQALFFKLFGVTFQASIIGAAASNVVATFLVFFILRRLVPSPWFVPYLGAMLTAVWFYPPFGTLYTEQTGFLLALAGMWCVAATGNRLVHLSSGSRALFAAAGGLATATFLTKQNIGAFIIPLYPVLMLTVLEGRPRLLWRALAWWFAGALGIFALFWAWLAMYGDIGNFLTHVLELPAEVGQGRLFKKGLLGLLKGVLIGVGPKPVLRSVVVTLEVLAFVIIGFAARHVLAGRRDARVTLYLGLLCVFLIHVQHLYTYTALNDAVNGWPFLGLIVAVSMGLLYQILAPKPEAFARVRMVPTRSALELCVAVLGISVTVVLGAVGIRAAMTRQVHDLFSGSRFSERISVPGLEALKWGVPTQINRRDITKEHIEQLYGYLRSRGKRFFVFPHFTIFYGLLEAVPPQPLVCFFAGVTHPERYDARLDKWIVADLERNGIDTVVLETVAFGNVTDMGGEMKYFPEVRTYLERTFEQRGEIGMFRLYEKRRSGPHAG